MIYYAADDSPVLLSGSYSFSSVAAGFTYVITPSANRYTFTPANRTVLVNGTLSNQNFAGTR
jgi:hypothetical protein